MEPGLEQTGVLGTVYWGLSKPARRKGV